MEHRGTKTLESERLLLRRFTIDDAQAMFENWASDPEVTKFLTWQTHENAEGTKALINSWVPRYIENEYYNWVIVLKENGSVPIGNIAVPRRDDKAEWVEIGYSLGSKWWRQGIITEAVKLLLDYFFYEVGVNRVQAMYNPANPNSGKVMQKCGMVYEGTMRDEGWDSTGIGDRVMYGILAREYVK